MKKVYPKPVEVNIDNARMVMRPVWTKEHMRKVLNTDMLAVEWAVVQLQNRTVRGEGDGRGWNRADMRRGKKFSDWIRAGRHLTGDFKASARKMVLKYAGQLTDSANTRCPQFFKLKGKAA